MSMVSPELLRRYPFFAGFTDLELKQLAMAAHEHTLSEKEVLFSEGQRADRLYFLIEGEVEILMHADEKGLTSVALSTLSAGEPLGWSALVEPHMYTATARATRPARVVAFNGLELQQLALDAHLGGLLMKKVVQVLSRRLRDTRIQLFSLTAHAV
jgi:CRP-like cAMP-binding protein